MTFSSRASVGEFPPGAGVFGGRPFRQILLMILWAPVILVAGITQLFCHPRTKQILVSVVVLDIPLQWGAHLGMVGGTAASLGAMDGFDFSITTLALAGLYLGWLFTERAQRRPLRVLWNWPIFAYTAAVAASLSVATSPRLSMFQIYLMLELLLLYFYFAANITSREDVALVFRLILIGGIIESAYMLVVAAAGHQFALVRMLGFKTVIYPPSIGGVARYGGTIGSPNFAAFYLATLIILALAARRMDISPRTRRLAMPLIFLAAPAILLTLSRGGWLELTIGVGIFLGAVWVRRGLSAGRLLTFGMLLILIAGCFYLPNPVSKRLTENDNGSAYSRIPLMHLADDIIAAHPVLGVGANNFASVMRSYEGPEFRHAWIYTVHNEYLLVWSETGFIGLIAFLWIFGSLIRRGWGLWKARDAMFAPLGLGIAAAICGLLPHMFVELFSGRAFFQLVWILTAMVGACEMVQLIESEQQAKLHTLGAEFQAV